MLLSLWVKTGLKLYPLNRYVIERDGNGDVIEIVTKERINKDLIPNYEDIKPKMSYDSPVDGDPDEEECDVYTHVRRDNNRFVWYQEVHSKRIPGSQGKSPIDSTPWLPLRFNTVDGEAYGRGRVGQFIGDLKSLEALSQAIVEGSAAAAKVVFTVSPSSTTKPQTLAAAGNGAIVQGRPDDIGVVQVGKTADFATALQHMQTLREAIERSVPNPVSSAVRTYNRRRGTHDTDGTRTTAWRTVRVVNCRVPRTLSQ